MNSDMRAFLIFGLLVLPVIAQDYHKPPSTDWPLVGGDWGNTRYSTLARIDTSNVKTLKGAWMARLQSGFGPGFSQQGTPVVKDGVMYVTTGEQEIFALNGKTGNLIWEYRTPTDPKTGDNKAKRGIALGEGMVFGVENDIRQPAPAQGRPEPLTRLFALDQKTGKTLWKVELGADVPKELRQYAAVPPLYFKGLVYVSISGGDGGLRGRLTAHDAKTGKEVWRWWAVPGPGEFGHDTWEGDSWKTGGGAMWVQPALDPDLGLLYVNTGNPWPDYNGSARAGDNLFTDSVVALDAMTGKYRWHYQSVHHDITGSRARRLPRIRSKAGFTFWIA
jgi:quinohemoprotein ethanol dehydrogenase